MFIFLHIILFVQCFLFAAVFMVFNPVSALSWTAETGQKAILMKDILFGATRG